MPTTAAVLIEGITCPNCDDIEMYAAETRYAIIHTCGVCGHIEER